jgi:hypothetical protein
VTLVRIVGSVREFSEAGSTDVCVVQAGDEAAA